MIIKNNEKLIKILKSYSIFYNKDNLKIFGFVSKIYIHSYFFNLQFTNNIF